MAVAWSPTPSHAVAASASALSVRDRYEQAAAAPPAVFLPTGHLGHRWLGTSTGVANTWTVSRGELILSDAPFDDTGADSTPQDGEAAVAAAAAAGTLPGLCPGGQGRNNESVYGNYTYPSGPQYAGGNTADIVEVRVAADSQTWHLVVALQNLVDPATTVVALGIDTDGSAPRQGAGLAGFAHVLQVTASGATLDGHAVAGHVDAAEHTYEAAVPAALLSPGTWRVAGVAGTWASGVWSAVTDITPVPDEPLTGVPNCWDEKLQSQLIQAGTYPTAQVDTARLLAGASDPAQLIRGPQIRLDVPWTQLGSGIQGQTRYSQQSDEGVYYGRLQPYAAYVPPSYDPARRNPLIVLLHCLSCTHNVYYTSSWPGMRQFADSRGAVVITPLAYGEGSDYEGEGEFGVMEALADAQSRYSIDPDRIDLGGMSMGSLGTFRLGTEYPDLWARTFGIGNYSVPNCVSPSASPNYCSATTPIDYSTQLESARNLEWGLINGTSDELTPFGESVQFAQRLQTLGYAYRLWLFPGRTHDPSLVGSTADLIDAFLGSARITDPAEVTYILDTAGWDRVHGLTYDRAYWVHGISLAAGAARGSVDAVSGRGTAVGTTAVSGAGTDAAGAWVLNGQDQVRSRVDHGNTLTLTLTGIAALAVQPDRAGLDTGAPLTLTVVTDSTVAVGLGPCGVLTIAPGTHHVVVSGCAGGTAVVTPVSATSAVSPLPQTGPTGAVAGGAATALALLGLLAPALRRRRSARVA